MRSRREALGRVGAKPWRRWVLRGAGAGLDVVSGSLTNLMVGIMAARTLSLSSFGAFSLGLLLATVVVGLGRTICGDPLVLRFAQAEEGERQHRARQALGAAIWVGAASGLVLAPVSAVLMIQSGVPLREAAALSLILGLAAPALLLQETARNVGYCNGHIHHAALNNGVRLCVVVLAIGAGALAGFNTSEYFLGAWALSGLGAALVALRVMRMWPSTGSAMRWVRTHRALAKQLVADFVLTLSAAEGAFLVISLVAGAGALGSVRLGLMTLAPITLLSSGALVFLQPTLLRRASTVQGVQQLPLFAHVVAAVLALCGLGWATVVYFVPKDVLVSAVGASWNSAHALVPLLAAYLILGLVGGILGITLRSLGVIKRQVQVRAVFAPLSLVAVAWGATRGSMDSALMLCVGVALVVVAWEVILVAATPGASFEKRRWS